MAKQVRGHPTYQPPKGTGEPEANPSVPQLKEHPDTTEGGVIVDCNLNIYYEGS